MSSANTSFSLPRIARFWPRLAAAIIDGLLLGAIGQVLGWTLSVVWFQIGPYGRFVGFAIALLYFGLLNSKLGRGQTVGKRVMKIAVCGLDNQPIALLRSMLRALILIAPTMLNGWGLPILELPALQWAQRLIVFGLGLATAYTMIFNRKVRQGFHDLLCSTRVIQTVGYPIDIYPPTPNIHWVISILLIVLAGFGLIGTSIITPSLISNTRLGPVFSLYQNFQNDPRFFTVGVNDNEAFVSGKASVRTLTISAWQKGGMPSEVERTKLINDIAQTALAKTPNIKGFDRIRVNLTSAYDLGIASGNVSYFEDGSIADWQARVPSSL